jgi:hypothetical protein
MKRYTPCSKLDWLSTTPCREKHIALAVPLHEIVDSRCDVPSEGLCGAGIGVEGCRHDSIMEMTQPRGSGLELNNAAGEPYLSESLGQLSLLVLGALFRIARTTSGARGAPSECQRNDTNIELLQFFEKSVSAPRFLSPLAK